MQQDLTWRAAAITDVGTARSVNEDSFFDGTEEQYWVVADGMGGHAAGDLASQLVVTSVERIRHPETLGTFVDLVDEAIYQANDELIHIARTKFNNQIIGSTVSVLLAHKNHCAFLWAGDSRIYRVRDNAIALITPDHSQAEEMVEQGLLSPKEAEAHPSFNILTRAVGAQSPLALDLEIETCKQGDIYVLCSDGLNKAVPDTQILQVIEENDIDTACSELVELAKIQGSKDNVTVIVVSAG